MGSCFGLQIVRLGFEPPDEQFILVLFFWAHTLGQDAMASVWAHAHLHRGPLRCGKEMRGFQSTCKENKERNDIEYGRK